MAPNRLQRNFEALAPNRFWTGDITYLATRTGFVYLAMLLHLFARAGVGFALDRL